MAMPPIEMPADLEAGPFPEEESMAEDMGEGLDPQVAVDLEGAFPDMDDEQMLAFCRAVRTLQGI